MESGPGWLRVRLAADAASVPGARRFVVDGLTEWGEERFAEVAELVVSELTSNVALHAGAAHMYLTIERSDVSGVRITVEDDGLVGAEVVHARTITGASGPPDWMEQEATGRGLAIVAMLAHEWGVDVTPSGKQVWARLIDTEATHVVRPPHRAPAGDAAAVVGELPSDWVLVRLARCPVVLSLQQDRHLDELVRELQLLAVHSGDPRSARIAEEIRDLLVSPAHARLAGRRTAQRARDEGLESVDVEMAMPRDFSGLIVKLQRAVARADELCDDDRLLTLASSAELRELRAWMTHEVVAQATLGAAPVPWPDWSRGRSAQGGLEQQ